MYPVSLKEFFHIRGDYTPGSMDELGALAGNNRPTIDTVANTTKQATNDTNIGSNNILIITDSISKIDDDAKKDKDQDKGDDGKYGYTVRI